MSEFEQMMAEIQVPEAIALQISQAAVNGEVLKKWEQIAPAIDEIFGNDATADCICALAMLNAYIGEKLAMNIKFGESEEDEGDNVHPNFCIMAIALIAVQTLAASKALTEKGDEDGGQEKGKEKGSEEGGKDGNGAAGT